MARGKAHSTVFDSSIAINTKAVRTALGLSLADLARVINGAYDSNWQGSTIFKIENGRKVSVGEAFMIADALGVTIEFLAGIQGKESRELDHASTKRQLAVLKSIVSSTISELSKAVA